MDNRQAALQAFYDTTIAHLVAQGRRAVTVNDSGRIVCQYRAPDGTKCAAGAHIPDDRYQPSFESRNIAAVLMDAPSLVEFFPHTRLAETLQSLHDKENNWNDEGFANHALAHTIAARYNLTPYDFTKAAA